VRSDTPPELEYFHCPADSEAAVLRQDHQHRQGMRLNSGDVHPWEKVIKARLGLGGDLSRLWAGAGCSGPREAVLPFPLPHTPIAGSLLSSPCPSCLPCLQPLPQALLTWWVSCPAPAPAALGTRAHTEPARQAFGACYRKVTISTWRIRPHLRVVKKLQHLLKKRSM